MNGRDSKMPRKNYKKIFISWSGDNSKEIAKEIKKSFENKIFKDTGLSCFVSDVDISSGDDWWNKIKKELKKCKLGIVCITKENLKAPWIYFESGAMVARELRVIPLLVNCGVKLLRETPIASKHMVDFYNREQFIKMVQNINNNLALTNNSNENLETLAKKEYKNLISRLAPTLKQLKAMRVFNEKYIYPSSVHTVTINTVYISAPMSSIQKDEYDQLRDFLMKLKPKLENLGFTSVLCPLYDNPNYGKFDGSTKAIQENFVKLKQVDSMIVICPNKQSSSILVEIGYGIALCKKTVIFHKESLPFMLQDAGQNISHIATQQYSSFDDIMNIIDSNGKQLFKREEDE